MDTVDLLREAWKAVQRSEVPEYLHVAAFNVAAERISPGASTSPGPPNAGSTAELPSNEHGGYLDRIAAKLKTDRQVAEHVFNQNGDDLEIVVAPGKLEKRNSAATKQLAILTVSGRQAAGLEEWTSTSVIRAWCEHFKKLDAANFAATMKELDNLFTMRGSARGRQMRITAPGWVEAARLISQLGGSEA